jgi:4-hydroxybenzoate polyprenyltransferase
MSRDILDILRPNNWYKNLVLFACIIFSSNLLNHFLWTKLVIGFIAFCFISSSIYIINDILDRDFDKSHPRKKNRAIASGRIGISQALLISAALSGAGFAGAVFINISFLFISLSYFILMLIYSVYLKHYIIVDVLVISIGFVIRAIAGCIAINVFISPWLVICAFLLALFLAFSKRKSELVLLDKNAGHHRKILSLYSNQMLDQMISVITATLIMSYSLYTFLTNNVLMMITIPFAIYGLLKYQFLIYYKNLGGRPEKVFKDKGIVVCIASWLFLVVLIVYNIPENLLLLFKVG